MIGHKFSIAFAILFIELSLTCSCLHIEKATQDIENDLNSMPDSEFKQTAVAQNFLHSVYYELDYQGFYESLIFLKHAHCDQIATQIEQNDLKPIPGGHLRFQPFALITPSDKNELFLEKVNMNQLLQKADPEQMFHYLLASLLTWVRAPLAYDEEGNLNKYNRKVFELLPFPSEYFNTKLFIDVTGELTFPINFLFVFAFIK